MQPNRLSTKFPPLANKIPRLISLPIETYHTIPRKLQKTNFFVNLTPCLPSTPCHSKLVPKVRSPPQADGVEESIRKHRREATATQNRVSSIANQASRIENQSLYATRCPLYAISLTASARQSRQSPRSPRRRPAQHHRQSEIPHLRPYPPGRRQHAADCQYQPARCSRHRGPRH